VSYASKVKDELSRQIALARHCRIAELSAIISLCGRVSISADDRFSIKIHTESAPVARKYFTLLGKTFNIIADVSIRNSLCGKKSFTYSVAVGNHEDALKILMATKLLGEDGQVGEVLPPRKNMVVKHICCRRAFLRGAFLASGSISDPEKSYHFEIVCAAQEKARQLQGIIGTFGLEARIVVRKNHFVVYLKEGSQIVDILNVMEAPVSLMDLENIRILKEMRGQVNRQVNCETANINKTVSAAVKQLKDIEYIRDTIGFSGLSENLESVAYLRLERPEASLKELGEALDPPVGKSGVNHRLRKLSAVADALRKQAPKETDTETGVGPSGKEEENYDKKDRYH